MLCNSLNAIKNNLERDIDLNFSSFKCQAELNYNFTIFNNNTQNKILSLLLLAAVYSNYF